MRLEGLGAFVFVFVLFICLFDGAQRVRMWDAACGLDDR